MGTVTVPLSDEGLRKLEKLARDAQSTPEELVRGCVEEWLMRRKPRFRRGGRLCPAQERRPLPATSMIRYLTLAEVLVLHERLIDQSGGTHGVRDQNGLESAIGQPMMAFGGQDLYQTTAEKGAALAFSLVMNHPFVDGNNARGPCRNGDFSGAQRA